jgi:hypothetical protein
MPISLENQKKQQFQQVTHLIAWQTKKLAGWLYDTDTIKTMKIFSQFCRQ